MKNIAFQLDDQVVGTLGRYAQEYGYDVHQLANELIEGAILRLGISASGDFDRERDEARAARSLTSEKGEREVRALFEGRGWGIVGERRVEYGKALERFVGKKVSYTMVQEGEVAVLAVSDEKLDLLSELTRTLHHETNQIFSWMCPYWKEVLQISYKKGPALVEVLVC